MSIKVLILLGSPREGGNTDTLANEVEVGMRETAHMEGLEVNRMAVRELDISPCMACYDCREDGKCVREDDMQDIYKTLEDSDILVVSSPVFFMGVPAGLKAVIDRCQSLWIRNFVLGEWGAAEEQGPRKGVFISVCGQDDERMFTGFSKVMKAFFATTAFEIEERLLVKGVDGYRAVLKEGEALSSARDMGRRLIDNFLRDVRGGGAGS